MNNLQDKVRGSLAGGAVGDALGYPIEFIYSFEEIKARYGEEGLQDYDKSYPWLEDYNRNYKALFSDDTQMGLYTAEGLLYAEKHGKPITPMICNAYLAWLGPQIGKKIKIGYPSELAKIGPLNQRRAPGNTCISALLAIRTGKEPMNNSKGCGGVMRIAPIALYGATHGWTLEESAKLAGEVAEITHLHQMSTLASACCAAIIQQCVMKEESKLLDGFTRIVEISLDSVEKLYAESPVMAGFKALISKALRLKDNELADWQVIEGALGGGWVAEETLAIALFCVARHLNNFNDCVVSAVNHGGDSDSTGAVAGNIIGAILGYDAIPQKFIDNLELKDVLVSVADDLCGCSSEEQMTERYKNHKPFGVNTGILLK